MDDSNDQGNEVKVDKQMNIKSSNLKTIDVNRNFLQNKMNSKTVNRNSLNYKQNTKVYNTNLGKRTVMTRRMNMRGKTGK